MNKELESLNELKNITIVKDFEDESGTKRVVFASEVYEKQFDIIETNLKKIDKAINLIKEKNVDVYWLRKSPSLPRYNIAVGFEQRLLKKEYNLLKEIFE